VVLSVNTWGYTAYNEAEVEIYDFLYGVEFPTIVGDTGGGEEIFESYNITYIPLVMLIGPDHQIISDELATASAENIKSLCTGAEAHECDMIAEFSSDVTAVLQGGEVNFTNETNNNPDNNFWQFEGGDPTSSIDESPAVIYSDLGVWNVLLSTSNVTQSDTVIKEGYITVLPVQEGFSLDFEDCPDWTKDMSPWKNIDVDQKQVCSSYEYNFPHEMGPVGFIAFNPAMAIPSASDDPDYQPHGGDKCGIALATSDDDSSDDWLISPKITLGTGSSFSFWVKSAKPYYIEPFRVGISTTGDNPADFTIISSGDYEETTGDWTQKTYDISNYDNQQVYVAINYIGHINYIFMIDDILIETTLQNDDVTGMEECIKVYPNPSTGIVTVCSEILDISNSGIKIINVLGEIVKTLDHTDQNKWEFDLSGLPGGIYYIEININDTAYKEKIILQ